MLPMATLNADPLQLNLQVRFDDPDENLPPLPKAPVQPPHIGIEGYTLYMYTPCDGCELRLVDAGGYEVYSTIIPTSCTSLDLPTTFSGEYELQIIRGSFCFYTIVEL